jgi:hypothetical protein
MDLWAISNQCFRITIADEMTWNSNPYYFWKGILIFPSYPNLIIFAHMFVEPVKPLLRNVGDNISFLKINNCAFSISCDWCSLVNGTLETIRINLNKYPELLDQVDFVTLRRLDTLTKIVFFFEKERPIERINKHRARLFGNILTEDNADKLSLIAKFYSYTEILEKRWCPFKRAAKLYYRNPKYMSLTERNIRNFGKIVSKYPLVCNNCNFELNQTIRRKKTDNYIFQPLLEYLINISG